MVPPSTTVSRQRSERRIAVRLPLNVRGRDARGFAFEEDTSSENLCRNGAAFVTRFDVAIGADLEIRIPFSQYASRRADHSAVAKNNDSDRLWGATNVNRVCLSRRTTANFPPPVPTLPHSHPPRVLQHLLELYVRGVLDFSRRTLFFLSPTHQRVECLPALRIGQLPVPAGVRKDLKKLAPAALFDKFLAIFVLILHNDEPIT